MHQGNRFQNKDVQVLFLFGIRKGECVCVILFHLLCFEGKKKRPKQMMGKKRLSRGFAGRNQFLNALFKKRF